MPELEAGMHDASSVSRSPGARGCGDRGGSVVPPGGDAVRGERLKRDPWERARENEG